MSKNATATENGTDKRTLRAQWEGFEFSIPREGAVVVTNASKADPSEYTVALDDGRATSCECPDWTHREPTGGCKHMRAVEAQGSVVLAACGLLGGSTIGGRPDDCACLATSERLPCWPCYQAGYETPNPTLEEQ